MKTKHTLTIMGAYGLLFGLTGIFGADHFNAYVINSENPDVIRLGRLLFLFIGGGLTIWIGLIYIFARNAKLAVAKNLLLAHIIGSTLLICIMSSVGGKESLFIYNAQSATPDILLLGLAIFGYLKAK